MHIRYPFIPLPSFAPGMRMDRSQSAGPTQVHRLLREQTQEDIFYHDVPRDVADQARNKSRGQSDTPGRSPWPLRAWPDVPTRFIRAPKIDFFHDFMRRVVVDRYSALLLEQELRLRGHESRGAQSAM